MPVLAVVIFWVGANAARFWDADGSDLGSTYLAARVLDTGASDRLYAYDRAHFSLIRDPIWDSQAAESGFTGMIHPYLHAPLWAELVRPLARTMDFRTFHRFVLVLNLVALFIVFWLCASLWLPAFRRPHYAAPALVLFAMSEPFEYSFYLGQTQPIAILGVAIAVFATVRRRPVLAGVSLAAAAMLKITPAAIAIYWLVTGRRRELKCFTLGVIGLTLFSVAIAGVDANLAYLDSLARVGRICITAFNNQSLVGWLSGFAFGTDTEVSFRIVEIPKWMSVVNTLAFAVTLGASLFWTRVLRRAGADFDRFGLPATVLTILLFSPLSWTHYYVGLIIPLMAAASWSFSERRFKWSQIVFLLIIILNFEPLAVNAPKIAKTDLALVRSHYWSGCLLFVLLAVRDRWSSRLSSQAVATGVVALLLITMTFTSGASLVRLAAIPAFAATQLAAGAHCREGKPIASFAWQPSIPAPNSQWLEIWESGAPASVKTNVSDQASAELTRFLPGTEGRWRINTNVREGAKRRWVRSWWREFALPSCP